MKKLIVTMTLELTVPDDWELVTTSGDTDVVKLPNGTYLDMTFEPLVATDPEETWASSEDDQLLDDLVDRVEFEDVRYELIDIQ